MSLVSTDPTQAEPGGGLLIENRPQTQAGDGDHERFAHYVKKDKIVDSAVLGTPVIALCGKTWVPGRDPSKFPVCPDCLRIYSEIPRVPREPAGGGGPE